jgi:hypothetical protein
MKIIKKNSLKNEPYFHTELISNIQEEQAK